MVMIIGMHQVNIGALDLNLVKALDALLRWRSVSRAAEDVGLSQPAMSRALARLREVADDPLLVRTPAGYMLTPRAKAIQPALASALASLREVFQPQAFDPLQERRVVRLAASDAQTVLLLPGVVARLAREAPGVELRAEPYGADLVERLEGGSLDMAFAVSTTPLPPGAYSEAVGRDGLAVAMRRGHPAAGRPWRIEDYAAFDHVAVSILGDGQSELDARLAASGVKRRIAVTTPHFMAALAIAAATDLVTTLSATLVARFAEAFGLVAKTPPFGEAAFELTMVCAHVQASDPLLAWLRGVVREVAASLRAEGGSGAQSGAQASRSQAATSGSTSGATSAATRA